MSNRCWATGGGTSYHEDRPLKEGRLPSYTTVERRLHNNKESGVCPCRAEPKRAGCYPATVARQSVNTTLRNSNTYHVTVFCVVHAEPK